MIEPSEPTRINATKEQRFNHRPGRETVVTVAVSGMEAEIVIRGFNPRKGAVELRIPKEAKISHRPTEGIADSFESMHEHSRISAKNTRLEAG